ncbi:MAG: cation:proton antiporter domain-containing protein [Acidimicrobiia bacterium]
MEVVEILLDILIVLVAAKIAAEIAERIQVPVVVGEIAAGMLIGPSVLGLVGHSEVLATLAELGVILLLLEVGMEMNLGELRAVGKASILVAIVGVVVPMATGFGVSEIFGYDFNTALFLGAALAATSVGITARVFSDLRALATIEARTVLGAAVADDVLGLVILTVVVRIVTEGTISLGTLLGVVGVALAFLVLTTFAGQWLAPKLFQALGRYARSPGTMVAIALAFTLAFAELADLAKLAPIIGAFVAGLSLGSTNQAERIRRELRPVGHLFIPVFFLGIGIEIDVQQFFDPTVLGIAAALLVVAIGGKMAAAMGLFGSPGDKLLVGIGMIPRGEVGLIFATIGLREGVLGKDLFASLLLVVLITTIMTPPLLKMRLLQVRTAHKGGLDASEPEPPDGWLVRRDGVVDLGAAPPERLALYLGLDASLALVDARPGPALLDWLGNIAYDDDAPLRWDEAATERLLAVLANGNVRSWRFLEATGLLERSLPELAEAIARRRSNAFELDPGQILRFTLVDRIRELARDDARARHEHTSLAHPDWLLLAALILETVGDDEPPVELARRLVKRLDLGAAAEQEVAFLLEEASLMRGMAMRIDSLGEEAVVQLAVHLDSPERARALYLLSVALGDLEASERERLDELLTTVLQLLQQEGLTGLEARNTVERRRAEALRGLGDNPLAANRLEHAPRAYLLAQDAVDVARQVAMLSPLPGRNEVRVGVEPVDAEQWRIEVASRDRAGLLAMVSGVLAGHGVDVLDAVVATWDDGAALEAFLVQRAPLAPPQLDDDVLDKIGLAEPEMLAQAIEDSFGQPLVSPPNPDADVRFDDDVSPWYTICEVRSPDRRGLLHTITVGLAAAGANVHSARLVTEGGRAVDRFELTDANGRKLDADMKHAIRSSIAEGAVTKRKRARLRR